MKRLIFVHRDDWDNHVDGVRTFQIRDDDKILWRSSFSDPLYLSAEEKEAYRDELRVALTEHGLDPNLVSGHWATWGTTLKN